MSEYRPGPNDADRATNHGRLPARGYFGPQGFPTARPQNKPPHPLIHVLSQILGELEDTNRLLEAMMGLKLPVHPTVEELGLVDHDPA